MVLKWKIWISDGVDRKLTGFDRTIQVWAGRNGLWDYRIARRLVQVYSIKGHYYSGLYYYIIRKLSKHQIVSMKHDNEKR